MKLPSSLPPPQNAFPTQPVDGSIKLGIRNAGPNSCLDIKFTGVLTDVPSSFQIRTGYPPIKVSVQASRLKLDSCACADRHHFSHPHTIQSPYLAV